MLKLNSFRHLSAHSLASAVAISVLVLLLTAASLPQLPMTSPACAGTTKSMLPRPRSAHPLASKLTFLVGTGAQVSVLPPTRADHLHKQEGFTLSAVNSTAIATYGTRSLTLNISLRRTFQWIFVVANISKPILGADFLHHFGILFDIAHGKLVDTNTHLSVHGVLTEDSPLSLTISRDNLLFVAV